VPPESQFSRQQTPESTIGRAITFTLAGEDDDDEETIDLADDAR